MFEQSEYLEILFKNLLRLIDVHTMKVQLIMTFFAAQPSDKGKVSDAQQVVIFVTTSKNIISITIINSFRVFMFYLVKIFQFYSFIIL